MLLDGFMTLHNKKLRDLIDLSLFFDLPENEQVKRRKQRQPDVEEEYLHHIMLPCARKYIIPSKKHADHVIDATRHPDDVAKICHKLIKDRVSVHLSASRSKIPIN